MAELYDLVGFTTATVGTGTVTAGAALAGHRTMVGASIPDGTTVSYGIKDNGTEEQETGRGVVGGSGTTLTRSMLASSTGSLLNLSGDAEVTITGLAADFADLAPAGSNGELQLNNNGVPGAAAGVTSPGAGALALAAGTLTANRTALSVTQTWNNGTVTFDGIDVDITNTASASTSRFIRCRMGATDYFTLTRLGAAYFRDSVGVGQNGEMLWNTTHGLVIGGTTRGIKFTSTTAFGTIDAGIFRNAAGVVEINNGTVNQYRDLLARNVYVTTGIVATTTSWSVATPGGTLAQFLNSSVYANKPPSTVVHFIRATTQNAYGIFQGYVLGTGDENNFGNCVYAGVDATDVLALRRGANAQSLRIYKTNDASGAATNFERLEISGGTTDHTIATQAGGTGTRRNLTLSAPQVAVDGLFMPKQYTTATRPAWVNGAVIFDTDLDKMVIGGVSGWEVVTSA